MVSDNVRARIQILTALEREYYEWSLKLASHQYKMGPKHLQEEYWKEHEGIIMTLRTVKEKMANIVDN